MTKAAALLPTLCRKYEGELKMARIAVNGLQLHLDIEIERAEQAEAALAQVRELPPIWRIGRGPSNNWINAMDECADELEIELNQTGETT